MSGSFLELQKIPHPKKRKKDTPPENHQKTNKRGATICKRKGSTIWKLHSVFLFFRSVREKLRK
jgi:hypothetical protein